MKKTINNELKAVGTLEVKGNFSSLKQCDKVSSVEIYETNDLEKFVFAKWFNKRIREQT